MVEKHTPNGGSLKDYRTLLLKIVERIEDDISSVKKEVSAVRTQDIPDIKIEIAEIKTENRIKASLYGMLGGGIPAISYLIYKLSTQ